MKAALSLPPTATPAQILRACCAGPGGEPNLMFPFLTVGKAGRMETAATDGETIALWTAGKLGPYRAWTSLNTQPTACPTGPFRQLHHGGTHPLSLAVRNNAYGGEWAVDIGGSLGLLSEAHYQLLSCLDSCYLGRSTATPQNRLHNAISIRGTCGPTLFTGVIICPIFR